MIKYAPRSLRIQTRKLEAHNVEIKRRDLRKKTCRRNSIINVTVAVETFFFSIKRREASQMKIKSNSKPFNEDKDDLVRQSQ